jgi:hypothetical protein
MASAVSNAEHRQCAKGADADDPEQLHAYATESRVLLFHCPIVARVVYETLERTCDIAGALAQCAHVRR